MPTQKHQDPRWRMRWVTLYTFLTALLCSFIAGSILAYQTKSPIPLAVPGPLLIAMRPIIRYLFGR
jgi:hypothetical protein